MNEETLKKASLLFEKKKSLCEDISGLYNSNSIIVWDKQYCPFVSYGRTFSEYLPSDFNCKVKDFIVNLIKDELAKVEDEIKNLEC